MTRIRAAQATSTTLRRRMITPEGLDLRLTLASGGERATAFLLDMLIMMAALVALTVAAVVGLLGAREDAGEIVVIIWLLGAFLLRNGYFVIFELGGRAATPGKRALRIRVASRDGGRLTAEAIFTRNAMREIEVFLPLQLLAMSAFAGDPADGVTGLLGVLWSGLFMVFPLFNRDHLRVGDLVAGTWVVRAPRERLRIDLAAGAEAGPDRLAFTFTAEQTGAYGVKELEILEGVLRRREAPVVAQVAKRIRAKIEFDQPAGETDEAFLLAYYGALRARLEHRLLLGHRRRDKFDVA